MSAHVFKGLWCQCGERHHQSAAYYVSVVNGEQVILAAGPFAEHGEALAHVDAVRDVVAEHYGKAHDYPWYGYGTTAMRSTYRVPGKLNKLVADRARFLAACGVEG